MWAGAHLSAKQEDDLKAWVGAALPRSTRGAGAWIEKECGLVYESRSGTDCASALRPALAIIRSFPHPETGFPSIASRHRAVNILSRHGFLKAHCTFINRTRTTPRFVRGRSAPARGRVPESEGGPTLRENRSTPQSDDPRSPEQITHSLADIIHFRLLMISAGYEDGNDASNLRGDPMFKMALYLSPSDRELCSQSTISRLENLPDVWDAVASCSASCPNKVTKSAEQWAILWSSMSRWPKVPFSPAISHMTGSVDYEPESSKGRRSSAAVGRPPTGVLVPFRIGLAWTASARSHHAGNIEMGWDFVASLVGELKRSRVPIWAAFALFAVVGEAVAQGISPQMGASSPEYGAAGGMKVPARVPNIVATDLGINKKHSGPSGKPCVTVSGVALREKTNAKIFNHVIVATNECAQVIKMTVCYYESDHCVPLEVPPYSRKQAVLGVMPAMDGFRFEYRERFDRF
jgi:hypothetical protein